MTRTDDAPEPLSLTDRRRVVAVLVVASVLVIAYWTVWFADRPALASNTRPAYYEFENAFPLADAWLATCCGLAAWRLHRRSPTVLLWLLLAAGSGVFLFAMDVLYDVEHAIWWRSGAGGVVELAVNLLTGGVAAVLLRWTWTRRLALLRASPVRDAAPGAAYR